jgi:hypothetical protein
MKFRIENRNSFPLPFVTYEEDSVLGTNLSFFFFEGIAPGIKCSQKMFQNCLGLKIRYFDRYKLDPKKTFFLIIFFDFDSKGEKVVLKVNLE